MGFLFLDIESFVAPHNERSGLNPHHDESKVIVIAYNYYDLRKAPCAGEIKAPTFLYDWVEGSEKELLDKFWGILKEIHESDDFLKIVGFNQLAYDLPYLFSRMDYHAIAHKQELFDIYIDKSVKELREILIEKNLPLSGNKTKQVHRILDNL